MSRGDQVILKFEEGLSIIPLRNKIRDIQEFVKSKNPNNISLVESLIETRLADIKDE